MEAYAPLVTKDSYCVVFDTVIEDMPPEMFEDRPWGPGNNPKTATWEYLKRNQNFIIDESIQKLYIEKDGKFYLDVDGHEKNEGKIPLSRLNQEIDKRKQAEKTVAEIADSMIEALPEDFRDLVPDTLPASEKIKWIRAAELKGLFTNPKDGLDSKKPSDKQPPDFSGLSPQAIMARGYKS